MLFVLLLLQAGGLLVVYELQQVAARWKMHEAMEKFSHPVSVLRMSSAQYKLFKVGGDELRINGKMYDIRSIQFHGDSVTIIAIHDEAESRIVQKVGNILFQLNTDGSNIARSLADTLSYVYLVPGHYFIAPLLLMQRGFVSDFRQSALNGTCPAKDPYPPRHRA